MPCSLCRRASMSYQCTRQRNRRHRAAGGTHFYQNPLVSLQAMPGQPGRRVYALPILYVPGLRLTPTCKKANRRTCNETPAEYPTGALLLLQLPLAPHANQTSKNETAASQ